ncbi:hypothetical protein [Cyanobacterium sp. Dongsha4]|uniref:hypothetical protein n=1 Tax=Cyanobacterium sp. DS4 TaxID=2878255 RepID=UPI002E800293|nr:hypothetical protein [Cyanobacterium sp. Dongsha4]WVL00874.1 hypothetical protein Dongsha4_01360 [Cyanobacterium sp. Dongsha4]
MSSFLGRFSFLWFLFFFSHFSAIALPPPDDIPEEVLATEIITEARSPLNNEPLTTEEYATLTEKQAKSKYPPQISSDIRQTIFLLRVLNLIRTISPF